jgi:hypothetical protein
MAYTMTHGMMTHYKMTLDKKKKKDGKTLFSGRSPRPTSLR